MRKMKIKMLLLLSLFSGFCIITACTPKMSSIEPTNNTAQKETGNDADVFSRIEPKDQTATEQHLDAPYPPVMIYKTKRDRKENVPVILSDDRSSIVSYPSTGDVYYKGELAYPVELASGYLLDQRGINARVAFLDYTYEEYSRLEATPLPEILVSHIIDKDPLIELYSCKCARDTTVINEMIREGNWKECKRLK